MNCLEFAAASRKNSGVKQEMLLYWDWKARISGTSHERVPCQWKYEASQKASAVTDHLVWSLVFYQWTTAWNPFLNSNGASLSQNQQTHTYCSLSKVEIFSLHLSTSRERQLPHITSSSTAASNDASIDTLPQRPTDWGSSDSLFSLECATTMNPSAHHPWMNKESPIRHQL